jgi:hypothetical protein
MHIWMLCIKFYSKVDICWIYCKQMEDTALKIEHIS